MPFSSPFGILAPSNDINYGSPNLPQNQKPAAVTPENQAQQAQLQANAQSQPINPDLNIINNASIFTKPMTAPIQQSSTPVTTPTLAVPSPTPPVTVSPLPNGFTQVGNTLTYQTPQMQTNTSQAQAQLSNATAMIASYQNLLNQFNQPNYGLGANASPAALQNFLNNFNAQIFPKSGPAAGSNALNYYQGIQNTAQQAITTNAPVAVANIGANGITATNNTVSQTITGTLGSSATNQSQTLGTINYIPIVTNGELSLVYSSFTPTEVSYNYGGGVITAPTTYNPTTGQIGVNTANYASISSTAPIPLTSPTVQTTSPITQQELNAANQALGIALSVMEGTYNPTPTATSTTTAPQQINLANQANQILNTALSVIEGTYAPASTSPTFTVSATPPANYAPLVTPTTVNPLPAVSPNLFTSLTSAISNPALISNLATSLGTDVNSLLDYLANSGLKFTGTGSNIINTLGSAISNPNLIPNTLTTANADISSLLNYLGTQGLVFNGPGGNIANAFGASNPTIMGIATGLATAPLIPESIAEAYVNPTGTLGAITNQVLTNPLGFVGQTLALPVVGNTGIDVINTATTPIPAGVAYPSDFISKLAFQSSYNPLTYTAPITEVEAPLPPEAATESAATSTGTAITPVTETPPSSNIANNYVIPNTAPSLALPPGTLLSPLEQSIYESMLKQGFINQNGQLIPIEQAIQPTSPLQVASGIPTPVEPSSILLSSTPSVNSANMELGFNPVTGTGYNIASTTIPSQYGLIPTVNPDIIPSAFGLAPTPPTAISPSPVGLIPTTTSALVPSPYGLVAAPSASIVPSPNGLIPTTTTAQTLTQPYPLTTPTLAQELAPERNIVGTPVGFNPATGMGYNDQYNTYEATARLLRKLLNIPEQETGLELAPERNIVGTPVGFNPITGLGYNELFPPQTTSLLRPTPPPEIPELAPSRNSAGYPLGFNPATGLGYVEAPTTVTPQVPLRTGVGEFIPPLTPPVNIAGIQLGFNPLTGYGYNPDYGVPGTIETPYKVPAPEGSNLPLIRNEAGYLINPKTGLPYNEYAAGLSLPLSPAEIENLLNELIREQQLTEANKPLIIPKGPSPPIPTPPSPPPTAPTAGGEAGGKGSGYVIVDNGDGTISIQKEVEEPKTKTGTELTTTEQGQVASQPEGEKPPSRPQTAQRYSNRPIQYQQPQYGYLIPFGQRVAPTRQQIQSQIRRLQNTTNAIIRQYQLTGIATGATALIPKLVQAIRTLQNLTIVPGQTQVPRQTLAPRQTQVPVQTQVQPQIPVETQIQPQIPVQTQVQPQVQITPQVQLQQPVQEQVQPQIFPQIQLTPTQQRYDELLLTQQKYVPKYKTKQIPPIPTQEQALYSPSLLVRLGVVPESAAEKNYNPIYSPIAGDRPLKQPISELGKPLFLNTQPISPLVIPKLQTVAPLNYPSGLNVAKVIGPAETLQRLNQISPQKFNAFKVQYGSRNDIAADLDKLTDTEKQQLYSTLTPAEKTDAVLASKQLVKV